MNKSKITRRNFLRYAVFTGSGALYTHTNGHYRIAFNNGNAVYKLRILHTNDHHSWIEPATITLRDLPLPAIRRDFGGVARRKTLIDQIKATAAPDENVFLLDAGDIFQGTLYFTQYNGLADLFFYNRMGYDAVTVGNHEFDKGQTLIRDFILGATFPTLSANINVEPSAILAPALAPSDIAVPGKLGKRLIISKGGKNIGIFGLTPPKTSLLSSVGAGVTFNSNLTAIAQTQVDALRNEGANYIIGLTHVGYLVDKQLAASVRGIDILIGGHSHTPLLPADNTIPFGTDSQGIYPTLIKDPDGKSVIVTTAWKWGRWLGDITLGFNTDNTLSEINGVIRPIWADGLGEPSRSLLPSEEVEIIPDPEFQNQIDTIYKPPLLKLEAQIIGQAAVLLQGDRNDIRNRETNLGNFITDVMRQKMQPVGGQIAMINSGQIARSIPMGDISLAKLVSVLPFDNTLAVVDLTGIQILAALENAVSLVDFQNPNNSSGRFVQVSGLQFIWATNLPPGKRIQSVKVQSPSSALKYVSTPTTVTFSPIDLSTIYRVVTNNFVLGGGDGFTMFLEGQNKEDTGILLVDILSDYLATNSPISATLEDRITNMYFAYLPDILQF